MWTTRAHHRRRLPLLMTTLEYLILLSGRSRSSKLNPSFSFFALCSPLGRSDTFAFKYLPSTPCISLCSFLLQPHFIAPGLIFFLFPVVLQFCTRQPCVYTLHLVSLLINPSMSSWLRYSALCKPALLLRFFIKLHMVWRVTLFLAYSMPSNCISTFSRLHFLQVGTFLVMVLLVVLDHPSTCFCWFHLHCFQLFLELAFPSHTSAACSNFWYDHIHQNQNAYFKPSFHVRVFKDRIHLAYFWFTGSDYFRYVRSLYHRQSFKISTPRYVYWYTIDN